MNNFFIQNSERGIIIIYLFIYLFIYLIIISILAEEEFGSKERSQQEHEQHNKCFYDNNFILIDYDYGGYNYRAFDFANF